MRKEINVLLGVTKEETLVFADIYLGDSENMSDYFSVSFSEVRPIEVTDEYLKERAEGMLWGIDSDFKLDLLERYDCKPSELVDEYVHQETMYNGVEGILDISLYPESFSIDWLEDDVYFESDGCGQHDTRDILIPIDPEFSSWLHEAWDNYHLQQISSVRKDLFKATIDDYIEQLGDEEKWIQNWLETVVFPE